MGRSCFNIISCGCINESVDKDQIDVSSQNKGPDKQGWSFRKNSTRREAPSNTVVKEKIPSSEYKQIPEPIAISSEPQINCNISEKTHDNIRTEETPNSITKNATISTMATKLVCEGNDIKCERVPDESKSESESAVLVIQAAVRRFLAERRLVKHKNVVKLQAAVRGHLVRNHAVGTLRCVQAIVKMQALVRARREKGAQNTGIINSTPTHISIEKLLSNRLARQLLESTSKTKQINIKCDPLKSNSAWNWLERWMSVSSPETLQPHTPNHDQDKVVNNKENEVKMVISSNIVGEATVRFEKEPVPENPVSETKPNPIPKNLVSKTEPEPIPENPVSETKPDPIPENLVSETEPKPIPKIPVSETKPETIPKNLVSETEPKPVPEIQVSETEPKSIPENPVSETEPEPEQIREIRVSETEPEAKPILENPVSETEPKPIPENPVSETEPKHAAKQIGSSKASNPAFIVAQSKFEKLTSFKVNPLKSPSSSNQDDEPGSCSSSPEDIGSSDPLKPASSCNQDDLAGSGFGSAADVEPRDDLVTHGSRVAQNGGSECGTELSITSTKNTKFENTKFEEANTNIYYDNNIDVVTPEKQVDQKPDNSDNEPKPESRRITKLESQGTPSSQILTASKKTRTDKKVSSQTRKSSSTSKKSSPVSTSVDSDLRTSLEQLPKESKPVKRRTASGSPKPDHIDREPVVPGYMQPTESARAKVVANSSPRSSPDKETYLKKRQSLPGPVNGRHGSPRIQRSMSQEGKWQR